MASWALSGYKAMDLKKALYVKVLEMIKTALIIYTIRRFNPIPLQRAKNYYILLLSPLLLTLALLKNNTISWRYRKRLVNFTYPKNKYTENDTFKTEGLCETKLHPQEPSCSKSLRKSALITIVDVLRMYTKLYSLHGIVTFFLTKILHRRISPYLKTNMTAKRIAHTELISTLKSTSFLAAQTILQRSMLCLMSTYNMSIHPLKVYLGCILGSLPILVEQDSRVQQVNNLVISHILVGQAKKMNLLQSKLPWLIFTGTIIYDSVSLHTVTLLMSFITSCTF